MRKHRNALIVEDRENWQDTLATLLTIEGFDVQVASTLREAREAIRRQAFQVAVVDIRLEDTDPANTQGIEFLEDVKKSEDSTSVIILTGYGTVQLARTAFADYDVADFLEKEAFDREMFKKRVREASEGAAELGASMADQVKGIPLEQMVRAITLAGEPVRGKVARREFRNELNAMITELLKEFPPLMADPAGASYMATETGEVVGVRARYWSRGIGQAIEMRLGDHTRLQIEVIPNRIKEASTPNLIGAVYVIDMGMDRFTFS